MWELARENRGWEIIRHNFARRLAAPLRRPGMPCCCAIDNSLFFTSKSTGHDAQDRKRVRRYCSVAVWLAAFARCNYAIYTYYADTFSPGQAGQGCSLLLFLLSGEQKRTERERKESNHPAPPYFIVFSSFHLSALALPQNMKIPSPSPSFLRVIPRIPPHGDWVIASRRPPCMQLASCVVWSVGWSSWSLCPVFFVFFCLALFLGCTRILYQRWCESITVLSTEY